MLSTGPGTVFWGEVKGGPSWPLRRKNLLGRIPGRPDNEECKVVEEYLNSGPRRLPGKRIIELLSFFTLFFFLNDFIYLF